MALEFTQVCVPLWAFEELVSACLYTTLGSLGACSCVLVCNSGHPRLCASVECNAGDNGESNGEGNDQD